MFLRRFPHDVVDSTSERAFAEIAAGTARHGDVHLARAQTAGRGRFGRAWSSPAGEGLYLSAILLPCPTPWSPAALTMAAGLAVCDAARDLGAASARLKWPNDVIVGDAKLAGVIVETRGFSPERPHYVVGVGLNVAQRDFPPELLAERAVASLATLGLAVSVARAADAVLDALARRLEQAGTDAPALAADFLRATGLERQRVRVQIGELEREGALEGLCVRDGLLLRTDAAGAERFPLEIVRRLEPCL